MPAPTVNSVMSTGDMTEGSIDPSFVAEAEHNSRGWTYRCRVTGDTPEDIRLKLQAGLHAVTSAIAEHTARVSDTLEEA